MGTRTKASIIFAVFLILGGVLLYASFAKRTVAGENDGENKQPQNPLVRSDADNDGLSDWEEVLYHTDKDHRDTDRDGISDYDEIAAGENPLKAEAEKRGATKDAAQNDYLRLSLLGENNLTATVLEQFLSGKTLPQLFNAGEETPLGKELGDYLKPIRADLPQFNENVIPDSLLTIAEEEDERAIKTYLNAITSIYEKVLVPIREKDMAIIRNALEEKNNAPLAQFNEYRAVILRAHAVVLRTPVPRAALTLHKKEIWYLKHTAAQADALARANVKDPLHFLVLLQLRLALKKEMAEFHAAEVPEWLAAQNITLTKEDNAHALYSNSS